MKEKFDEAWRYYINKYDPDAKWFYAVVGIGIFMLGGILFVAISFIISNYL